MRSPEFRALEPYQAQPPAAAAGTSGKRGVINLGFELDSSGRTLLRHWERRAPLIVQQALYCDEELRTMPVVHILSSGGPEVDGDRFEQRITLRQGAMARILSGAATKVATMRHNHSRMEQQIRLEAGAYLEWHPEPLIPCREARRVAYTEIQLAEEAHLCWAEVVLSGRKFHHDEQFAYSLLGFDLRILRPTGEELYTERQQLQPAQHPLQQLGILGEYEHFASLYLLGPSAEGFGEEVEPILNTEMALGILQLPHNLGVVCRLLGRESGAIKARLHELCSRFRKRVTGRPLPAEYPWR